MDATHDEAQLLVVAGVHGLALLDAAAVVGLALHVEGDPPQLEDDVPLSLRGREDTQESTTPLRPEQRRPFCLKYGRTGSKRAANEGLMGGFHGPHLVLGVHLGHHAVLQKVKGQHLQHVQLVGHLVVDGRGAPDHVLGGGGRERESK